MVIASVAVEQRLAFVCVAEIQDAAGFTRVFELMRASGKPAVGHNPLFDICYSLAAFAVERLPAGWEEFKRLAATWFPGGECSSGDLQP